VPVPRLSTSTSILSVEREFAQALSTKIEAERPLRDLARAWHEAETDAGE
jgi:hypothetical protein